MALSEYSAEIGAGAQGVSPGSFEVMENQHDVQSTQESNPEDVEVNASAPLAPRSKSRRLHFSISETDETDEDCKVINEAFNTIEDETSVPDSSGPDGLSSPDWSQEREFPDNLSVPKANETDDDCKTSHTVSVKSGEKRIEETPSKKRPLSLTRDNISMRYHKAKRFRSKVDMLKDAINNDHPRTSIADKESDIDTKQIENASHEIAQSSKSALFQNANDHVIPETDDEQLGNKLGDAFSLDAEDIDYWKEIAAEEKKRATKSKRGEATGSRLPQRLMVKQISKTNAVAKKVLLPNEDEGPLNNTKKGKSLKLKSSSQQSTRKALLKSQDSQSSQEYVPNSDDEFKAPRRTKRKPPKKHTQ